MKKTYSVTFLPDDKTVSAARGKSILEAAAAAGIMVNSVCGADGVCGKCRVIVKSGKVAAEPNMFLTRREIQRAWPWPVAPISRATWSSRFRWNRAWAGPADAQRGRRPLWARVRMDRRTGCLPAQPLSRKEYLELPRPSIEDNTCDQERVFRELRRRREIPVMQMGLAVLRRLPALLRDSGWKITALLGMRGGTLEVVDIEPGDTSATNLGVASTWGRRRWSRTLWT